MLSYILALCFHFVLIRTHCVPALQQKPHALVCERKVNKSNNSDS